MRTESHGNKQNGKAPHARIEAKAPMKPDEVEILLLRPDEVCVDREHLTQRGFREAHARKISKDYSPALASVHVSARADGGYYVCDGQHTCAAAIMAGKGNVAIPMRVHRGLSIQQEAKLFDDLNRHKLGTAAYDRFVVGITWKNPVNLEIVRVLDSFGLKLGMNKSDGYVRAVDALVQIYECRVRGLNLPKTHKRKKPEGVPQSHLLSRTLFILTQAWGLQYSAFDALLLKGVAALLYKHDTKIDTKRLSALLAKYDSPARASGKIRALKEASNATMVTASVQYLEGVYNRKLAENKRLV